jgi:hypothetical protein
MLVSQNMLASEKHVLLFSMEANPRTNFRRPDAAHRYRPE